MACKVLVLLAKGFETMEFSPFIDIMGWARNDYDCDITTETCGYTKEVISTFGIPVRVDKLLSEVNVENYAALAIPGGFEEFGFYEEAYDEDFLQLIRSFNAKGKLIASICVGALPVGKSGVLKGRRATTYHLRQGYRMKQLEAFGVTVIKEPIVLDRNIITSYCPQTAPGVAFLLLELLTTKDFAATVKTAMGYE
jgi:4-methyl-5(b-hydroxyethyl)-thiazole monophosphate biosynthesis